MATQGTLDRMCEKNFVKPGSPLEQSARLHAHEFFGPDGSSLEERFADFCRERRGDPFYADSFTAPQGPAKVAGIDTLALSEEQLAAIDAGTLVIEPEAKQESASIVGTVQPDEDELKAIIATGKVAAGK